MSGPKRTGTDSKRYGELVERIAEALFDDPMGGVSGQALRWAELYDEDARETWREQARIALAAIQIEQVRP